MKVNMSENKSIKIKKQTNILDVENLTNLTKENLIEKVKSLTAHNIQLKNLIAKQTHLKKNDEKKEKPFDFSKATFRHVALQLLYLGWDYKGYVVQEDTLDTIEYHLFEALKKTKLIKDRATSNYNRCGRTDKGVSSLGQVITIDLRSNSSDNQKEINYCKILNRVLPSDIQCVAWAYVDNSFSARFDCQSRMYKYYFPRGKLDIREMDKASKKLLGTHDYRNFCKMDVGNGVVEFTRNIMDININPVVENDNDYDMYVINIKAKAFLWHQIRCIMGVLFLIGQGKEKPEVIDELLDIEKHPRKPDYVLSNEIPLNLYHCDYDNISWKYDDEVLEQVTEKLKTFWTFNSIKATMIKDMVNNLQLRMKDHNKDKCLSENLIISKSKNYIPLLKRQTCDSLEEKIAHYQKRKRIEVENN